MEKRRPLGNFGYMLWTRQLAEELVAIGAPVVKTIDDCLDPDRAYELLPGKQGPRHSSATSPCTSGGGYGYKKLNGLTPREGRRT